MVSKRELKKKRGARMLETRRQMLENNVKVEEGNLVKKCDHATLSGGSVPQLKLSLSGISDPQPLSGISDPQLKLSLRGISDPQPRSGISDPQIKLALSGSSAPQLKPELTNHERYMRHVGTHMTDIGFKLQLPRIKNHTKSANDHDIVYKPQKPQVPCSKNQPKSANGDDVLDECNTDDVHVLEKEPSLSSITHSKNEGKNCSHNEIQSFAVVNEGCLSCIQGNFHQGNPRFHENCGKQCVANCLVSCIYNQIKKLSKWQSFDMDGILNIGNELYATLRNSKSVSDNYLLVNELPMVVELFDTIFTLTVGESLAGVIAKTENIVIASEFVTSLDDAILKSLNEFDACFITFAASTFTVIKGDGVYYVFDSHSRSANGLFVSDGSSCLLKFRNLTEVYQHCCILAASMNIKENCPFEVTGINVNASSPTDIDTECSSWKTAGSQELLKHDVPECEVLGENVLIECIEQVTFQYKPLCLRECNVLCDKLGFVNDHVLRMNRQAFQSEIGDPCEVKTIKGDGNCFFRAVSYAISGIEENHRTLRRSTVKHLARKSDLFQSYIQPTFKSVNEYITLSGMSNESTWATEVEIFATAALLETDIYTFSGNRWLHFPCTAVNENNANIQGAIYLKHHFHCHYDVVISVKEKSRETDCLGHIKAKVLHGVKRKLSDDQLSVIYKRRKLLEDDKSNNSDTYVKTRRRKAVNISQKKRTMREYTRKRRSMQSNNVAPHNRQTTEQHLETQRERYRLVEDFANNKMRKSAKKYKQNRVFRNAVRSASVKKYMNDLKFRRKCKSYSMKKYAQNIAFKKGTKVRSIKKYSGNVKHRIKVQADSIKKYSENAQHKTKVKADSVKKYSENAQHKTKVKADSVKKYSENAQHKTKVKADGIKKYATDPEYKRKTILYNKQKYHCNERYRQSIKDRNKTCILKRKVTKENMEYVQVEFQAEISKGPEYVCSVCCRRLFFKSVIECKRAVYENKGGQVEQTSSQCISERFLHKCSHNCDDNCSLKHSPASKRWICHTCHSKILRGKVPAEAESNNLTLDPVPPELQCLNNLEAHLIALHIPFIKLLSLPKGGQHGCHGPVVCVPSNIEETTRLLPRCDSNDRLIRVKLKRKLTYKNHHEYQFISKSHILNALGYLKHNNKLYGDVQFNEEWINPLQKIDEVDEHNDGDSAESELSDDDSNITPQNGLDGKSQTSNDVDHGGLLMDTCLQPVDIGQEILDQQFDNICCIAPAELNEPIRVLMDKTNEAKSFPCLFPLGKHTFHDNRDEKLTLSRYMNTRLLNADGRFARNLDYIFYAQYLSELNQVISNVSIALRKGPVKGFSKDFTIRNLTDPESLRKILKCDAGYKFLKPIRGTPPFWQSVQKDLFAMIRQLGIPTWFCSFSSADLRWTEIIQTILKEEGNTCNPDDLDWSQKCAILRRNPVTAARMFDHRFNTFLKKVIKSPAHPIGEIIDYFYRVEFQQRGSPHTHCLFWVRDAPNVDKDDDDDVTAFVDQYVSCQLPLEENDVELHNIVNSVQKHSKSHSKSCKKSGTNCRFNFPRPPSSKSFICRPGKAPSNKQTTDTEEGDSEIKTSEKRMTADEGKSILSAIWNELSNKDESYESVDALFDHLNISQELFEEACSTLTRKTSVVLKRQPSDVWINQYNPDLLRCWNANMDIQYIVDAYSCVVYVISYISKGEREMGLLLSHAEKEATKYGSIDAKLALKKLGNVYLHNREVCAQESIFRVCNMKLKEASRKVQFIPAGMNPIRMSKPLKLLKLNDNQDEDDIWMTSDIDRYKKRPNGGVFDEMCLATFCSEYRRVSNAEMSRVDDAKRRNPVVVLQNGMGFVQKRSRTDPAVVRYPRFSPANDSEKYYQSILQLFLPHRCESHLKPSMFDLYETFYESGAVKIGNHLQTVREMVDKNKLLFEKEADVIDKAEQLLESSDELRDAWAQISPETELERLECLETRKEIEPDVDDESERNIPDLLPSNEKFLQSERIQNVISREEAVAIMRSLNDEQKKVFYTIRKWCLDKKNNIDTDPFHLFLTGGAGTGKSHLIKAIYYEATRLLAPTLSNPDDTSVLLTAPTGVAAFNIGASTIHSALSIGIDAKLPYQPLGEEKINTLRSVLGNLHIMIIDEISMVDHKMLTYVHGRLRQIKQTHDYSSFGNVSIIAVGDFYQLPPVKGRPLYFENQAVDLWNDSFQIAQLTEIMRQKDQEFAEMLNHLRTRKKSEALAQSDVDMLSRCESGEESTALHIFAKNVQVDEFNIKTLHTSCQNPITIEAEDYSRNPNSGKLEKRVCHHTRVFRSTLAQSLNLAVGARVLMTKNIDVADGLVNGVFGTVSDIFFGADKKFPQKIFVVFDNEKVGQKMRKKSSSISGLPERSTPIEAQEEVVSNNGGIRRQFPLKLSWACTVHKVQGLTVKEAVVCLKDIFAPGQAYVALSRVTSLKGLTIQSFKDSVIYCNGRVEEAVKRMPRFIQNNACQPTSSCCMVLHNVEGLASHIQDIQCDERFLSADFICLTETWLSESHLVHPPDLNGFTFIGKSRHSSYNSTDTMFSELQSQAHGGVGVYIKNPDSFEMLHPTVSNMECLAFYVQEHQLTVAVIYRPSSYKVSIFQRNLDHLINELDRFSSKMVIMGDFNQNLLHTSSIANFMEKKGFLQQILKPTTECGTLIDHVYLRGLENVFTDILPTYFSFHDAAVIKFNCYS